MEHKLFSELIVKLPIKPDFFIAEKIDEIEIPFRNMKFVKKDINNLFLRIFNDFIKEYKEKTASYQNIEVMYDSSMSMFVFFLLLFDACLLLNSTDLVAIRKKNWILTM